MRGVLTAAALAATGCLVFACMLHAQPGGGPRFRGGPGGPGGFFGGGGILGLLQQREVQGEIELSDEQANELESLSNQLGDQIRGEMQDAFRGMQELSDEERQTRFDEIRGRIEGVVREAEGQVQQVLLPHQFERLKQIDVQARIQRGGAAALTEGELAETLGLSDAQREQLRERSEQVEQDMQEKIRQLRLEARNQLLDVLTAEQRARLEAMMGPQFDVPDPPPFGPGQRGGRFGLGGRGGRNRGGDRAAPQ